MNDLMKPFQKSYYAEKLEELRDATLEKRSVIAENLEKKIRGNIVSASQLGHFYSVFAMNVYNPVQEEVIKDYAKREGLECNLHKILNTGTRIYLLTWFNKSLLSENMQTIYVTSFKELMTKIFKISIKEAKKGRSNICVSSLFSDLDFTYFNNLDRGRFEKNIVKYVMDDIVEAGFYYYIEDGFNCISWLFSSENKTKAKK